MGYISQAVIMAGGLGTRMGEISRTVPKPMLPIGGIPVLEHQINNLKQHGINEIILVVGHLASAIIDYFGDGNKNDVSIEYHIEDEPLGSAGALYVIKDKLKNDFLLLNGDVYFNMDFDRFIDFHLEGQHHATILVHPNSHPYDSDLVVCDSDMRVLKWDSKHNVRDYYYRNLVNAGLHILNKSFFDVVPGTGKMNLESDVLMVMTDKGCDVYAYLSPEYVKDMGTPERLQSVSADYENGICSAKNLRNKQKCIFLDRDGTINASNGFISNPDDFSLLEKAGEAIKAINKSKYICIVITNQPVIARGECSFDMLDNIHAKMETLLGNEGAYIDDLYYCPHHPDSGYDGEVKELKIVCNCRKPATGLIDLAVDKYNIDVNESWFIGDTQIDVDTGKNAGMKTILLGEGISEAESPNLFDAIMKVLCYE